MFDYHDDIIVMMMAKMVMTTMTMMLMTTMIKMAKMTNQPWTDVLLHRMALKGNIRGQWKAVHQLEDIIFVAR